MVRFTRRSTRPLHPDLVHHAQGDEVLAELGVHHGAQGLEDPLFRKRHTGPRVYPRIVLGKGERHKGRVYSSRVPRVAQAALL